MAVEMQFIVKVRVDVPATENTATLVVGIVHDRLDASLQQLEIVKLGKMDVEMTQDGWKVVE